MEFIINVFPLFVVCIVICVAKIIEIAIQSVRVVFLVKGERLIATILAFIECLIWGLIISAILVSLGENLYWLLSYCLGFALGIYLGSIIENKIALGTSSLMMMLKHENIDNVTNYLSKDNRGFTVLEGKGSKGEMDVVIIVIPRKDVKKVMMDIREICNQEVFVVSSEVSKFIGGYGLRK